MLQLGSRKTCLDLDVSVALLSKEFLPMASANAHTPLEDLTSAEMVGRSLKQALTVCLHGAHPLALTVGNTVEEVLGDLEIGRIGTVPLLLGLGNPHLAQPVAGTGVVALQSLVGGSKDTGLVGLVHGNVAPPVHGDQLARRVVNTNLYVHGSRTLRKTGFQTVNRTANTLVLIHSQHLHAVMLYDLGVQAVTGIGVVPLDPHVPFHTAREPGVAQCQVAGLEHGVDVKQLAIFVLVVKRPKTSANLGQEGCLEMLVFQYHGTEGGQLLLTVISVLDLVRQNALHHAVADVLRLLLGERLVHGYGAVNVLNRLQVGQRIAAANRRRRHCKRFYTNISHW